LKWVLSSHVKLYCMSDSAHTEPRPDLYAVMYGTYSRKNLHLTPEGRSLIESKAVEFAQRLGETASSTAIHFAPELWARQTAQVFEKTLRADTGLATESTLLARDESPPLDTLVHGVQDIIAITPAAHVLLVGHTEEIQALSGAERQEVMTRRIFPVDITALTLSLEDKS